MPLWRSDRAEYQTQHGRDVLRWIDEEFRKLTYVWDLGDGVTKTKRPGGLPWEAPDVPDSALREGHMTDTVVDVLREEHESDQPWFLAVGYHKPHLPFVAPKRYFDLYDHDAIALADNPFPPEGTPPFALYNWNDLMTTEGGAAIDWRCRVLNEQGIPIPGLYAVGQTGLGGMILWGHGLHIAWALTSGRLVGRELAGRGAATPRADR